MRIRPLQEMIFYRHRYFIGYMLLIILTVGLLFLSFTHLPAGLSQAEESSALASSKIVFDKSFFDHIKAVDLPFHLLQKGSLELFGLSVLGVRLPSIMLGIIAAMCLFLMLHRWLQANVAVVTGVLLATSSWFLSIAREGTPDIMIIFWSALILLLATLISQETKFHHGWKALVFIVLGLSLYTPFMSYLLLAALVAAMAQPHLRYLIRHTDNTSMAIGSFFFILLLMPLAWNIYKDPGVIKDIFLMTGQLPDATTFATNLLQGFNNLLNPFVYNAGGLLTPLISIPMAALTAFGFWRVIADYHSVRSHVLLLWIALLLPAVGLSPAGTLPILLVPVILLAAIGVQALFRYWYGLFPRNPYARVFGLIPIGVLMLSMIQFNYQRYFVASPYIASINEKYNSDSLLFQKALLSGQYKDKKITLVVPADKVELYAINKNIAPHLAVVKPSDFTASHGSVSVFISENALHDITPAQGVLLPQGKHTLIVNDHAKDALRFRVYGQ